MFDFKLVHVPGKKFQGPDGLSRRRRVNGDEDGDVDKEAAEEWVEDILMCGVWMASGLVGSQRMWKIGQNESGGQALVMEMARIWGQEAVDGKVEDVDVEWKVIAGPGLKSREDGNIVRERGEVKRDDGVIKEGSGEDEKVGGVGDGERQVMAGLMVVLGKKEVAVTEDNGLPKEEESDEAERVMDDKTVSVDVGDVHV